MATWTPLLAETDGAHITDGLMLLVVGVSVVFVALVLILVTIKLLGRVDSALESRARRSAGGPVAGSAAEEAGAAAATGDSNVESRSMPGSASGQPALGPEMIAVLAAAATAAVRRPVRITRVRFVSAAVPGGWVAMGRTGIMTSHRPHLHRRR